MLAVSAPARATVVQELDLDQLTELATVIVHGVVTSTQPELREGRIDTAVQVQVQERLKGQRDAQKLDTVSFVVPGGSHGGLSQIVPGAPLLAVGDEVFLFLWRGGDNERLHLLGLSLGAFTVERQAGRDPVAVSDRRGLATLRTGASIDDPQRIRHGAELRLPLSELQSRVRALVPAEATR
jgi:hypothetical protein